MQQLIMWKCSPAMCVISLTEMENRGLSHFGQPETVTMARQREHLWQDRQSNLKNNGKIAELADGGKKTMKKINNSTFPPVNLV